MNRVTDYIVAGLVIMLSMSIGYLTHPTSHVKYTQITTVQPYCPTEDSCQPVYENGIWMVKEIIP